MARTKRTSDELLSLAERVAAVAATLREVAASMKEASVPDVLVHVSMPENKHLPTVEDWADKLRIDVRSQIRSYLSGVQSSAELHKQKTESQKRYAAKKPFPSKVNKKKG